MTQKKTFNLKSLCVMAMLTAIAIAVDILLRLSGIGGFLTYEPKEVVITVGAFIFGPVQGLIMSLVVCLVEMVTISSTGIIGFAMNFLASAVFVGISSFMYSRKKTFSRAILGLAIASVVTIIVMLLWNYIITPMYTGMPRQAILDMFLPLLIPFNAIKVCLNSALVMFLYKGVATALRSAKLIPQSENANGSEAKKTNTILVVGVSAFVAVTLVLVLLMFAGVL